MKQHIRRLLAGRSQPQRRGTLMRMIATRTEARPATGRARRLFTREDYHSMGRMGVLGPDERLELIEGEIIVMSPAGIRHSSCVLRLTEAFNTERLAGRALVHVQNSMAASNISEPEPDVMLLAYREDRYASRRPQPDDVILLIEVSDSSLKYDHDTKLPLYAESGIREVWIVDLQHDEIESHREPGPDGYRAMRRFLPGDSLAPTALPDLELQASWIMPPRLEGDR